MRKAHFAGGNCVPENCSCLNSTFSFRHNQITAVVQMAFVVQAQGQRISALQRQLQKKADEVARLTLELTLAQSSTQVKEVTWFDGGGCEAGSCISAGLLCCTAVLPIGYAGHRALFCMTIPLYARYCALSRTLLGFVAVAACLSTGNM